MMKSGMMKSGMMKSGTMKSGEPPSASASIRDPAMAEAVERLSALLAEENAALEAMDFARAGGLLAPKHAAADALAAAWRAAEPGAVAVEGLSQLGRLAEENRQLLKRAMRVQSRVLDLVAKAARGSSGTQRYGAEGRPTYGKMAAQSLKTRI
jgi:hypothetical protein